MASPGLSSTIILSEIIFLQTGLIIGAGVYLFLKAKKRSKKLAAALASFTESESERLNRLTNTLPKPDGLEDDKYSETMKTIISNENILFKSVIGIIYQKDLNLLDNLAVEIETITKPCADLLSPAGQPLAESIEEEPVIDVDDAIDDLLSDDEENGPEKDPAFDLSEASESPPEATVDDDGIAEIPSELLESGMTNATGESEQNQDDKPNADKSKKTD